MRIELKLTQKDSILFALCDFYTLPKIIINLTSLALIPAAWLTQTPADQNGVRVLSLSIFAIVLAIPIMITLFATKQYRHSPLQSESLVYEMDHARISAKTAQKQVSVTWDKLFRFSNYPTLYAFYIAKGNALLLPKHALTLEEQSQLKTLLSSVLTKPKK